MAYAEITSRDNERVKAACKIARSAAARTESGLFFAEGVRLCTDLAKTLRPVECYFTPKQLERDPALADMGEDNFLVLPHVAEKLSQTKTPQGVFCLFPLPQNSLASLAPEKGILVCEDIQDPANVGALIRSAAAFGYGGVVLLGESADPFSPKALRGSVGASARMPVVCGESLQTASEYFREGGIQIWGAALEGAQPLAQAQPAAKFALLIGNEGRGLSAEALAQCSSLVYIPMHTGVESLNAAVAAGVLLYSFKERGAAHE